MDFLIRRLISNFDEEYSLYRRGNKQSALFDYFAQFKCTNPFELPQANLKAIITKPGKVIEGPAILIYDNGSIYVGDTYNNQRIGKSYKTLIHNKDLVFVGEYSQDRKSGKGEVIELSTGNLIYRGDWHNGKKHGKGYWKNTDYDQQMAIYEGEFANDLMHGYGIIKWANGDKYEGYFVNGERSGAGIIFFANGDKYEGTFLCNKFEGEGKYVWKNGELYEGKFEKGKPYGTGSIHYNMNVLASGVFDGVNVKKGNYLLSDMDTPEDISNFDIIQNTKLFANK